jgi:hypothetical protein
MASEIRVKRRVTGSPGAPASLKSAEIAYNMVDGKLYIGYGDDGSGNATSVKAFAEDDYTGGGSSYTEGDGIDITGNAISLDPATFTGTWTTAQIPNLAASKITSGEFDAARIPSLDAAKIGSGTIDVARLPVLPSSVQIVSSGGIAALTSPQQAEIGDGSVVTTTDGRRWVYTGSGSKTAEASYIELADITPDWSVIANKPSFATVATSGAYNDLTGKPTLGTIAAQDANNVTITGGSISGTSIDGGTF